MSPRRIFLTMLATYAVSACTNKPVSMQLTVASAEAFMRQWLAMIDANASVEEFEKYLPDGDFEQWSYPDAEIKNTAQLKAFFKKTWGMIAKNTNTVQTIKVTPAPGGRFDIETQVQWAAVTATGQSISRALRYWATVGSGSSTIDPAGLYPKMLRYKIERR